MRKIVRRGGGVGETERRRGEERKIGNKTKEENEKEFLKRVKKEPR